MEYFKNLGLILLVIVGTFILLNRPNKLNDTIIKRIKNEGITHVTNKTNAKLIMDKYGYASFKASPRIKCYGSWFRSSVFFFLGEPSSFNCFYNIDFKKKDEYVIIKILAEDIDSETLKLLRWRKLDKAIMYLGDLKVKAKVETFKI